MDAHEAIDEVVEEIQEQLEEIITEQDDPGLLDFKLIKLQEKAQEFISDFQREVEGLEFVGMS